MNIQQNSQSCRINKVEITNENISGRGGLPFFLRYAEGIGIFPLFDQLFPDVRKSSKGASVNSIARQLAAFMADGTNMSLNYFNKLKDDEGYASLLEYSSQELLSSHSVNRFFRKFKNFMKTTSFRKILRSEFIRQLKAASPENIVLDIDTMVLNNCEANKRQGVKPTYKKGVKGFQNLQVTWNGILVDALFRNGSAHSNHGKDFKHMLCNVIQMIREDYSVDVPIIITMDSGFFSEENLSFLSESMKVTFIAMGKMYNDLREKISAIPESNYKEFNGKKRRIWRYTEFTDKRENWKKTKGYRVVHTQLVNEKSGQMLLDFIREDSFIYTNNDEITCEDIISYSHNRGRSELTNRSFKDFLTKEALPFQFFGMNAAWYYMAAISHSLLIGFRNEVLSKIQCISNNAMPETIRRQVFDIAAKIIKKGNYFRLKFSRGVFSRLRIERLWDLVNNKREPIPVIC